MARRTRAASSSGAAITGGRFDAGQLCHQHTHNAVWSAGKGQSKPCLGSGQATPSINETALHNERGKEFSDAWSVVQLNLGQP
jgi:hypothetical protein